MIVRCKICKKYVFGGTFPNTPPTPKKAFE